MRSFIKSFIVLSIGALSLDSYAQVGINTVTPDTSAALHIVSKPYGQGLLIPRLTEAQRVAIPNPAQGLMVYDLTANLFYMNLNAGSHNWFAINPLLTQGKATAPNVAYTSPVVTNVGIGTTNPMATLDVAGDINASTSVTTNTLNVNGFAPNALVPSGGIIMWRGASVPPGWNLCDGTNGTPDLRGKFVVGVGQSLTAAPGDINPTYALNQTGGENLHTIKIPELPKHTHNANGDGATISASGGNHDHTVRPNGQGTGEERSSGQTGGLANDSPATITTDPNVHNHPNGEFSGVVGDGTTQGMNSVPTENRPPYYVLAYIMKL
jgi:microcystin-dependent protein